MPSEKVKEAWRNYGVIDEQFMQRMKAAEMKTRELAEQFANADHRPILDAFQLITSKASFWDLFTLKLDALLLEHGLTVVLADGGQYVVSNENEPLHWFNDPVSAYEFALKRVIG